MTKEEHDEILKEFSEVHRLVQELNVLGKRIEDAADRVIEVYTQRNGTQNEQ